MANERADIAMTEDEVRGFLAAGRTLVLVTIGPDGVPDPVPMWFVLDDDGDVWMRTYAASQKVVNLRRDPRVAVLVETGDRYVELRGVQVTGRIELVDDVDRICAVFADLMVKYEGVDPAHRAAVMEGYRAKAAKQVALRLVPERVVSWDHRKQAAVRAAPAG
ncbi:MAG: TIGR03618 family F420-dependent PPOX class oxidoreductase [Candidatus Nanopelagicales bacterium]